MENVYGRTGIFLTEKCQFGFFSKEKFVEPAGFFFGPTSGTAVIPAIYGSYRRRTRRPWGWGCRTFSAGTREWCRARNVGGRTLFCFMEWFFFLHWYSTGLFNGFYCRTSPVNEESFDGEILQRPMSRGVHHNVRLRGRNVVYRLRIRVTAKGFSKSSRVQSLFVSATDDEPQWMPPPPWKLWD